MNIRKRIDRVENIKKPYLTIKNRKYDLSVLSVKELRELEAYALKIDGGETCTATEEERINTIMGKVKNEHKTKN